MRIPGQKLLPVHGTQVQLLEQFVLFNQLPEGVVRALRLVRGRVHGHHLKRILVHDGLEDVGVEHAVAVPILRSLLLVQARLGKLLVDELQHLKQHGDEVVNLAVVGHQQLARIFQTGLGVGLLHQRLQRGGCRRSVLGRQRRVDFFKRGVEQLEQRKERVLKRIEPLRGNLLGEQAHIGLGRQGGLFQLLHGGCQLTPLQPQGE